MAALFVLFGLLLNVASGAQLDRDPRAAGLGNGEIVRSAPNARLASRADDDRTDHEKVLASLPPVPHLVALAAAIRPAGLSDASAVSGRPLDPRFSYRARAPPAA